MESRTHRLLIGLLLSALTLAVYGNSFHVPIFFDSQGLLLQDPRIRAATSENVASIFRHTYWWPSGEAGLYRPLATLSYLWNYAILGGAEQAVGYHWVNLALHIVNVLLVFAVGRKLLGRLSPSVLLAVLWATHPASTEAVTNIAGRPDLLAAGAVLGGLLLYAKAREAKGPRRFALLVVLAALTTAGVYSKESAVMIFGVVGLYELAFPVRRRWTGYLFDFAAIAIPIAGMLFHRSAVLAGSGSAEYPFTDNPLVAAGFWTGRLTALKVLGAYLIQAIWPWRLSVDYSYAQISLVSNSPGNWILVLLLAFTAAAGLATLWKRNRTAFFLAEFALVVLLPASNLLFPIGTIRADRFLYLPSLGLLGCVVIAAFAIGSRMRWQWLAPALIVLLTAGFAVRTWARNAEWRDQLTLATADLKTSPHSFKVRLLRATSMLAADPSHANIDDVVAEVDRSLAILNGLPDLQNAPTAYYVAGTAFLAKGDRMQAADPQAAQSAYRRSRELLERCIAINEAQERWRESKYGKAAPGIIARAKPDGYLQLSAVFQRLGDIGGAFRATHAAQSLAPQDPRMYRQMADLFLTGQQGEEAAVALLEGMLITSDLELKSDLLRLYGSSTDPANCTLLSTPNGPEINFRCAIVREHLCAAAPGVIRALLSMGRRHEALETKKMLLAEIRCDPGPLNMLLP